MQVNLYNGDCLSLMRQMPEKSVDLVVTDPPYDIETSGAGLYKQEDKQYVKELVGMKDGFSEEILDELCRVMKKINIYIFCSQKQIIPLLDYFVKRKGCNWNILSWHKSNPIPACGNKYLTDTEFILFFREKGVKVYGSFDTKKTYYAHALSRQKCRFEKIVRRFSPAPPLFRQKPAKTHAVPVFFRLLPSFSVDDFFLTVVPRSVIMSTDV